MEKKLYELMINEKFEHLIPPLSEGEFALLTESIVNEGCRDAVVVWHGTIVDGHNRYRICHEHGIPFSIEERDFEDDASAQLWIVKNQLARRNVPIFVKCEMVLPLENLVKAEAKKRQGWRKGGVQHTQNSAYAEKKGESRDELARIVSVSHDTLRKVQCLVGGADEETINDLRQGKISIHAAYKAMKEKERVADLNPPAPIPEPQEETAEDLPEYRMTLRTDPVDANYPAPPPIAPPQDDLNDPDEMERKYMRPEDVIKDDNTRYFPGRSLVSKPAPTPQGVNFCPPDSVYDLPPVETYGGVPADNMELRGCAEFAHVYGETKRTLGYFTNRMSQIIRLITVASSTYPGRDTLLTMFDDNIAEVRTNILTALNYETDEDQS